MMKDLKNSIEKDKQDDPFYSEENVKSILKASEQIKRGECVDLDIEEILREHGIN